MNQETLEKEVAEYNEIIKKIQAHNEQASALEQERLLKLGRVQYIQELVSVQKAKELKKQSREK